MKLNAFATNTEKEVNGVWHDIGEGAKVLVARSGNKKYQAELRREMKPYRNRLNRNDPTMEPIAEKILIRVIAKTILLDCEGIEDDDGKLIKYDTAKGVEMLTDYPELRDIISGLSDDLASYQDEFEEEVVKNSRKSSTGKLKSGTN